MILSIKSHVPSAGHGHRSQSANAIDIDRAFFCDERCDFSAGTDHKHSYRQLALLERLRNRIDMASDI